METRSVYVDTLASAAEVVGGDAHLAAALNVPARQLARWLAGEEMPPVEAFIRSLDLIADGPYAPRRRVKVAVLHPDRPDKAS